VAPYDPGKPSEVAVEFATPDGAAKYLHRPGVDVVEPRKIVSRADDWLTAWRQFYF
jgi:D-aminopeptidase